MFTASCPSVFYFALLVLTFTHDTDLDGCSVFDRDEGIAEIEAGPTTVSLLPRKFPSGSTIPVPDSSCSAIALARPESTMVRSTFCR